MIPRPMTRSPGTRVSRHDTRQRQLESLAAEFALLAQRRARVTHRLELLDQQRDAAIAGLTKLQSRMAWLSQTMDERDPDLRGAAEPPPPPAPPANRYAPPERAVLSRPLHNAPSGSQISGRNTPSRSPTGRWRI